MQDSSGFFYVFKSFNRAYIPSNIHECFIQQLLSQPFISLEKLNRGKNFKNLLKLSVRKTELMTATKEPRSQ